MANNQYVNKVVFGNTTLIDISDTTAVESDVASGKVFYGKDGSKKTGTASAGGAVVVTDTADSHGGTIREITAVEISGTKQITTNGIHDVTEYAAVNVAVPSSAPSLQAKTHIAPTESSQTITPDTGYDGLGSVQIDGISSSYVGSGVTRQAAATITPTKSSQTAVAAGRYTTGAVTVAAIPAAYQDVTQVDAAAGDVASGKKIVAADGTVVTGTLAFQTIYSGSSAPSSSTGVNGDIYIQTA